MEVLTEQEYADKYNNGTRENSMNLLQKGLVQMSQTHTSELGYYSNSFWALDLPFLFVDHDHAARVLEGRIGNGILGGLERHSNIKGLAFTYSGGFRIVSSKKSIQKVEDFKGLNFRVSTNPISSDTVKAFGSNPIPTHINEFYEIIDQDTVDVAETTFPRFAAKVNDYFKTIIDTGHSLYLTSIMVNKDFWNELSSEEKNIIEESAILAAREERAQSIQDSINFKQKYKEQGFEVVDLDQTQIDELKESVKTVYEKYKDFFISGLINGIQKS